MSITNQNWLSQSLLPKDSSISIGSSDYPLDTVNCGTLNATNLTVTNQTVINNTDIKDPIVALSHGNTSDVVNSGILNSYVSSGNKWAGLVRNAGDSKYYLVKDATTLPTTSTDISALTKADLTLGTLTAATVNATSIAASTMNLSGLTASRFMFADSAKNIATTSFGILDLVNTTIDQTIAGTKTFSNDIKCPANTITSQNLITTNATYIGQSLTQNYVYIGTKNFAAITNPTAGCTWTITVAKGTNTNYCSALMQIRIAGSSQGLGNVYALYNYQLSVHNGGPVTALIDSKVSSNPPTISIVTSGSSGTATVVFTVSVIPDVIGALTACAYVEILCAPGFTSSNTWTIT